MDAYRDDEAYLFFVEDSARYAISNMVFELHVARCPECFEIFDWGQESEDVFAYHGIEIAHQCLILESFVGLRQLT